MERRALFAAFLIVLIFLMWQYLFFRYEVPAPQEEEPSRKVGVEPTQVHPLKLPRFGPVRGPFPEKEVFVETPLLRIVLSTRGGVVKSWQLKRYTLEGGNPVELVRISSTGPVPLASWIGEEPSLPVYRVKKERLILRSPLEEGALTFTYRVPSGLSIEKTFRFRGDEYLVEVELKVMNRGRKEVFVAPRLIWGPGFREEDPRKTRRLQMSTWVGGRRVERPLKKLEDEAVYEEAVSWIALHDTYFAAALLPLKGDVRAFVKKEEEQSIIGLMRVPARLRPGEELTTTFAVYGGPKELDRLKALGHDLDGLVNFGWFDFLARPVLHFLKFVHRYTGNYGIAIITLALLIKILSYPLTYKSFKSMQAMQQLQPKLAALKEKYKNNPKKLNEEMIELYRRHGVNPMSGCLPMAIQIPVFIAIYNVLAYAVELWRAPLDGYWIKDLSAKDPYYILPIIMGISMFIQQWISPRTGDPKQTQLMLYIMPLFMVFIFWNLPSGLNLYWAVFNILSIGQQYLFNQRIARAPAGGRKET